MRCVDLLAINNPPDVLLSRRADIYAASLRESPRLGQGNFARIGVDDLAGLFRRYDQAFLDGWLASSLLAQAEGPLTFRLSGRMSRAGGKTTRFRRQGPTGRLDRYEITIAFRLLLMTFGNVQRPVVVSGQPCRDRLDALQRIMEHEMIHLAELLAWGRSSCSARRFKNLAAGIFGHAGTKHDLVTPHELAQARHGVRVGSRVEFPIGGVHLVGRVNRISRRATVLVEASDGTRYTDGHTYHKYYVPVPMLRVCAGGPGRD